MSPSINLSSISKSAHNYSFIDLCCSLLLQQCSLPVFITTYSTGNTMQWNVPVKQVCFIQSLITNSAGVFTQNTGTAAAAVTVVLSVLLPA